MLLSVSWGEEWLGSPLCGTAQHREEGPKTSQQWLMIGSWLKTERIIDFAQQVSEKARRELNLGSRSSDDLRDAGTASGCSDERRASHSSLALSGLKR